MKRSLRLLPLLTLFSPFAWSQTPVEKTLTLDNIEIQGKRYGGLTGKDVKRVSVDNNLSGIAGSTADIFRQMPSVITDMEGGVLYRGSTNPGLLINGIPYGVMEENSGDMLIQLPALFFNQVSMTSTPSIELLPDGDAGILNLSSTYYSQNDSPLILTLGAGFQERYNAGAILNFHPGKFHILGKYNYRREYRKRTFSKTTTNKTGTTVMNNNASARPDIHLADLSVGYELTRNDLVTVYGLYSLMDYSRYGKIHNYKQVGPNLNPVMYRHRYNNQRQEAYAAEARWNHTFNNPLDQLNVTFNYNNFMYDEENDYKNEKPDNGLIVAEDNFFVQQKKDNYYLTVAYRKVLAENLRLHLGYIGRFRDEDYNAEGNKLVSGNWVPDMQKQNIYTFKRRTNLLYASIDKKWNAFSAEAGVQAEMNWQDMGDIEITNSLGDIKQLKPISRNHFYPRIKVAYQANNDSELAFNYIQRTIRPYGADLFPFIDYSDATHIKEGNPDLKDEIIHSLELSYRYTIQNIRISPSIYYRNKKNRIMETAYAAEGGKETIWQKQNIGHSGTFGLELSATWQPSKIVSFNFSGNVFRNQIDGRNLGYDTKKSMTCGDLKGSININITSSTELQLDGFYISDQLTPQGKIKHRSSVNAGLSQYFMQRKLRANLSINNIFNTLEETTIIDTPELKIEQIRNRDAQVTWLTLTYNL